MDISRDKLRTQPNVRATTQEVFDGLTVKTQNYYPSITFDVGGINNVFAPFFSAGFYYKTFMWPKQAWKKLYEPVIREAAGLGHAPKETDPDRYANRFAHCDVMIIGGGAAGLMAAKTAAASGKKTILCDENADFGGWLLAEGEATIDGHPAVQWAAKTVSDLAAMDNVKLLSRTTAFGYYAQNMVTLAERITDHLTLPDARHSTGTLVAGSRQKCNSGNRRN